ncbi:MAG: ATP-binding cassette domain-containing protein [Mariprofundales bacterium]
MLFFDQLSLRHGKKELFNDVSFTIHAADKVGLTGANGCGKSSLFSLVLGQIEEDRGRFHRKKKLAIAHVSQETPAVDVSAITYVMEGDAELSQLHRAIAEAEQRDENSVQLIQLHDQMQQIDGYAAPARAARLLHGLGFTPMQEDCAVKTFSGGWRMRLNLAQALMCRSDLLLLDEPTNHLDLEAVIWLERWLRSYSGALLLISHDRDFLDRCVQQIAHIEQQSITLYNGNYSAFERQRSEQLAQQQGAYERQQREIGHMTSYIDRFRAKATKARQAQSRIKALKRMQMIAPAHVDSPFSFAFKHPETVPNPLLSLNKIAVGYGDDQPPILQGVSLGLLPGDRIGLLGFNGAGKSTLIKMMAGSLAVSAGSRQQADGIRIGYFAQHQVEQLMADHSPLQHLQKLDPCASERELRNFLGGFDFVDAMAMDPVAPFSGGEKARLVLAMLVFQQPNLLLLDEPTNHLDLEMRHALTVALQSFEGAMVLVSHDRHLLRTVCDSLLLVADGSVVPFNDDLEGYASWLLNQNRSKVAPTAIDDGGISRKEQRRQESAQRKRLQPLRNQVKTLEQALETLQQRKAALDVTMADPVLYKEGNTLQMQAMSQDYAAINRQLNQMEEEWLQACEQLEMMAI